MKSSLILRPATLDDAALLRAWRNDPDTRLASHHSHEIPLVEHQDWLSQLLANSSRRLFIAEESNIPVGSIRADIDADGVTELSWGVAPEARGQGIGKRMIAAALKLIDGAVRAEIKAGNVASMRIAESAGLRLVREAEGVLHYVRAASDGHPN